MKIEEDRVTRMNWFAWVFLIVLALGTALQVWLALRHGRHVERHADDVPAAFADRITSEVHHKAAAYTQARLRIEVAGLLVGAAVLVGWTLGGGIAALGEGLRQAVMPVFWQGVLLVVIVFLVIGLVELPLQIWRTFGVEARFGFNRTTAGRFVTDRLLGLGLAALLGGPLLVAVLWLMESLEHYWWLAAWAVWLGFSLTVTWAFPRFIAPLFNRFTPLDDTALRERLERLLSRCGFSADGVFVMDGSRRSAHGNAYFTGVGRHKRIVFFDTLMQQLEARELEAVLAHELGHYRLHHIRKGLAIMALSSLAGLAILGWVSEQDWFYAAFGITEPTAAKALVLFLLVAPAFLVFLQPLTAALSRRHEFEADTFAARHAEAEALVSGLVKMYRDNASPLVSDPLYAAFHFSHPPPAERVARLQQQGAAAG